MKDKPHYAVCDGKGGAKFPRTPEGLQAAIELAQELLQSQGSIQKLFSLSCDDFCKQNGLGPAKYVQLQAVLELSKRFFKEQLQRDAVLDSPLAVANYLKCQLNLNCGFW